MSTTSKKPDRARAKKPQKKKNPVPTNIRAVGQNPCDDQNGVILCWGGHQTNKPFPTTGGPWVGVVSYNSQTGLMEWQWADLTTLCPGDALRTVAAPCRPCLPNGEIEDQTTEQSNS